MSNSIHGAAFLKRPLSTILTLTLLFLSPFTIEAKEISCRALLAQSAAINDAKSQVLLKKVFDGTKSIDFKKYEIPTADWNAFLDAFRDSGDFAPEQVDTVFRYVTRPSKYNSKLRSHQELEYHEKKMIYDLDKTFKRGFLKKGTILLRGIPGFRARVGAISSDPGFVSTTIRPKIAYEFATYHEQTRPAILMLKVTHDSHPAMIPLSIYSESTKSSNLEFELEVLLPRGARYKIISKETTPDDIDLYRAELLPYQKPKI